MDSIEINVLVLVKAAPVLTRDIEETMCVAGVDMGGTRPAWIRLHPVPFRDLDDDSKFAKYQTVSVQAIRPKSDRRPESWTPLHGSIQPAASLSTDERWAQRRHVVDQLGQANMCDLREQNKSGSGSGTPSLAVVRPVEPPRLRIAERAADQLKKWRIRAAAASSKISLFDDPEVRKPDFEVVPWRFQYEYQCAAPACSGHLQTIVDWEVLALWRRVRDRSDWQEQMRRKFEDALWEGRDAVLFVGNQEQHPTSFLVLGVFWPPVGPAQGVLDL